MSEVCRNEKIFKNFSASQSVHFPFFPEEPERQAQRQYLRCGIGEPYAVDAEELRQQEQHAQQENEGMAEREQCRGPAVVQRGKKRRSVDIEADKQEADGKEAEAVGRHLEEGLVAFREKRDYRIRDDKGQQERGCAEYRHDAQAETENPPDFPEIPGAVIVT